MRTVALIVGIAVGGSGCAIAAAKGPGPGPVMVDHRPDCNTGKGGVVADGLGAAVLGITSLALVAADEGGGAAIVGLATVGLIGSAISGSRSADRCREAETEWAGLVMDRRAEDLERDRVIARAELDEDLAGAVAPPVVAPRPPVVAPRPPVVAPRPPVVAPRPPVVAPRPPVADVGDDADDADDDADAGDAGDRWSAFWREVTP